MGSQNEIKMKSNAVPWYAIRKQAYSTTISLSSLWNMRNMSLKLII